jgi:hypothetical protein
MLENDTIKNTLRQKRTKLGENIFSCIHDSNKVMEKRESNEIVTANNLISSEYNQEFQRT